MRKYVAFVILLLMGSWASFSQAFGIVINDQQVTGLMSAVFPVRQTMGTWQVTLLNPVPEFLPGQQQVALAVDMQLQEGERQAKAWGKVSGQLAFDKKLQQLHLVRPKLVDFEVRGGDIEDAQPVLDGLRQYVGQDLPVIVLFDVKQMNLGLPLNPTAINVVNKGIAIEF
ncbi:hypothetical protein BTA51_03225 [Hahella sp. CCB-MM4]|uniref:DUF1439 domain-containing protein n=1 Tax=Hahella sp. (strain CCB-MM4) TaxID=1926491 RepID=UPI000B9C31A5|nr:DUF1439 domain-containing protein [Hahella sp. CCB-MM4]OZG75403.1 hypothetical protein BTA51_03225 [Hahella sp. CCB-MM4]